MTFFTPKRLFLTLVCLVVLGIGGWFASSGFLRPPAAPTTLEDRNPKQATSSTIETTRREYRVPPSARAAAPREADSNVPKNAGDLYKRAFALLETLTEEEMRMIRSPWMEVEADKAAALFEKIGPILELLREAAAIRQCDWGLDAPGIPAIMTIRHKADQLGELALWGAAYRFATDPAGSIEDLTARAQLGHSLPKGVESLGTQIEFEKTAMDLLAEHAPSMDAATVGRALELLTRDSYDDDIRQALRGDARMIRNFADTLAETQSFQKAAETLGVPDAGDDLDRETKKRGYATAQALVADLQRMAETATDLARMTNLPEPQFEAWWKQVQPQLASLPIAKDFAQQLDQKRTEFRQTQVRRAMLAAGLTVMQGGQSNLGRILDPTTRTTFAYVPQGDTFSLRSGTIAKSQPVTMVFPVQAR